MEEAIPSGGNAVPPAASAGTAAAGESGAVASPLERLASFRFTYIAFCVFVLLYVTTVRIVEASFRVYFDLRLEAALDLPAGTPDLAGEMERRVRALSDSAWIRVGGLRIEPVVLGADGRTVIYASGRDPAPRSEGTRWTAIEDKLLPVRAHVSVSVPHNALVSNGVLVFYAAFFLTLLFVYTRVMTRREQEHLDLVLAERDALSGRAARIDSELAAVRERLARAEPAQESDAAEIRGLRGEREGLVARLAELERREVALRADNAQSAALREEYGALEGLLEEALGDLSRKDEEVRTLQKQVKQRPKSTREDEQLGRRLRTLYKNLELDERAIDDLVGLRDEALKLRAEESLKRLADDADNTAVRRKVGGLPPHLSIFELGFAGGGRIYYTRGRVRRFRVLSIGDKASQKRDLEYLSRLPRE